MRTLPIAVSLVVLCGLPSAGASDRKAPTEPGKYKSWGGQIDELEVVNTFKRADYAIVLVEAIDSSKTPLPPTDENTYAPVKKVLENVFEPFLEGVSQAGVHVEPHLSPVPVDPKGPAVLVVRASVERMDPGSKAKRYFGGFGAGAAKAVLAGEVIDARSGATLLRFRDERRSGFGMMGGSYVDLMHKSIREIGQDVGLVLTRF